MTAYFRQIGFATTIGLLTASASAHPGHGKDGGSHEITHYLTEPVHLLPLAIAVFLGMAAAGIWTWRRTRS